MNTHINMATIAITLRYEDGILAVYDSNQGYVGDIYLSESDGTSLTRLFPAFKHLLPYDADIHTNRKTDVWITSSEREELEKLDDTRLIIHMKQVFTCAEDGDPVWDGDEFTLEEVSRD